MSEKSAYWSGEKGVNWGRVMPTPWTAPHGDWVFCLGVQGVSTSMPSDHSESMPVMEMIINPDGEYGDSENQLSGWSLSGAGYINSDSGVLYWKLTNPSTPTVGIYRDSLGALPVALGSLPSGVSGQITLSEVGGSGITGSVNVDYSLDDIDVANNKLILVKQWSTKSIDLPYGIKVGDRREVKQSISLTGINVLRMAAHINAPSQSPDGTAWEVSILIDGTKKSRMRINSIRTRTRYDMAANTSKLDGSHLVSFRLELVSNG